MENCGDKNPNGGDNLDEASSSNLENPNGGDNLEEASSSNLENPNGGDNLEEASSSNLENPNDNLEGVLQRWKILKQELGSEIESEIDSAIWWASFVARWEEEVELREKEIEDRNRVQTRSEADLRLREETLRRCERTFLLAKALKLEERPEPTYDVRTRPNVIKISSLSKDLQKVKIGLCVLASPGENFDERALLLIVNETMKTVVSQYNASQILTTERENVIKEIKDKLTKRAINFKMVLDDVSITISLLTAVGPEYTLFVDEKFEKDNTSALIRAQDLLRYGAWAVLGFHLGCSAQEGAKKIQVGTLDGLFHCAFH